MNEETRQKLAEVIQRHTKNMPLIVESMKPNFDGYFAKMEYEQVLASTKYVEQSGKDIAFLIDLIQQLDNYNGLLEGIVGL